MSDQLCAGSSMNYTDASILIVDDEEANRDILSRRLTREGYTIAEATGGKQALDMMRVERYDLVLLDIMMPGVDGYQVLKTIKTDTMLHDVPVIMVSALSDEPTIKRCLEMGATDYVSKPFEITQIKTRIWHAIRDLHAIRRPPSAKGEKNPGANVLVIDDDEMNGDILMRRLKKAGHAADVASSGAEALALLEKRRYDLILLDIMMAKMDGFEVLEKIRQRRTLADVPVIMVSAINDTVSIERCMQLGADDFITKPYNSAILKERVLEVLKERMQRDILDD